MVSGSSNLHSPSDWFFVGICSDDLISFVLLKSGRLIKKALPLIAFSFTIILTIFLIHGLVNQQNKNVLFAIGFLRFYKEGLLYAAHIGLNILNMLLSFTIVVLSTRPSELVDELERKGFLRDLVILSILCFRLFLK